MSVDQDGCECECFFWYRPTRVVPEKGPLNVCVCVCVRACVRACVFRFIEKQRRTYDV